MGFSFPRLIAAVKRWPLAIASWINDPRLDRLRHLAITDKRSNELLKTLPYGCVVLVFVSLIVYSRHAACDGNPTTRYMTNPRVDGWSMVVGGVVMEDLYGPFISLGLTVQTSRHCPPLASQLVDMMLRLDEPSKPRD